MKNIFSKWFHKFMEKTTIMSRFSIGVLVGYLLIMGVVYFLAHDQLFYQDTQGYCEFPGAEYATNELYDGVVVEQLFDPGMNMLKSVRVQVATFARQNQGTLHFELWDRATNEILKAEIYDMSSIEDMAYLEMHFEPTLFMDRHNLSVRLYSQGAAEGEAIAPLIAATVQDEHGTLFVNGQAVAGRLSMEAYGQQTIRSGPLYPYITLVGFLVFCLLLLYVRYKNTHGKAVYCFLMFGIFKKYSFLISQLVISSFKTKYKRSVLGVFWSFLNPLMTMCVQYIVFSTLFKGKIEYYSVYLLIGITFFNFFNASVGRTVYCLLKNAPLIKKVYVPKWIYPFSDVLSCFVDFTIAMIPLTVLTLLAGVRPTKAFLLVLFPLGCILVFTTGFGILMSSLNVYFRDTEYLWGVVSMLWMYATPIFYTPDILPEPIRKLIGLNPIYMFINFARTCIIQGISPYPSEYIKCAAVAIVTFLVGFQVFRKMQDGFLLRL